MLSEFSYLRLADRIIITTIMMARKRPLSSRLLVARTPSSTTMVFVAALSLLSLHLGVVCAETPNTCVLTGLPPHVPSVTASRCPEASQLSCCEDCADVDYSARAVSLSGVDVINLIGPMGGIFGGSTFRVRCDSRSASLRLSHTRSDHVRLGRTVSHR